MQHPQQDAGPGLALPSMPPLTLTVLRLLQLLLALLLAATATATCAMARLLSRRPHTTAWKHHHRPLHRRPATAPRPGRQRRGLVHLAAFQSPSPAAPSHVTIVGGGLAGLSTAWHLASTPDDKPASITIVDPRPPGQAEASSVAGGLLHPLTPKNKLIWAGLEGFEATGALLAASKAALERAGDRAGAERLHSPPGAILRPALTPQHEADYPTAASKLPEWLEWLEGPAWRARATSGAGDGGDEQEQQRPRSGLLLKRSVIISMPDYLRGLWLALEQQGRVSVRWERAAAPSLGALLGDGCGALVVASGAGIRAFPELQKLPVELVRGRTLLVEDEPTAPLPSALLCGEYVVPGVDATATSPTTDSTPRRVLRCGATREYIRDPWARTPEADETGGPELLEELRRKAEGLHPGLVGGREAYGLTTGTRVAAKRSNLGKLPIVGRVPLPGAERRVWLYTGLGGRGMIHHAYLGGLLARAIVRNDEEMLPQELRAALGGLRD